MMGALAASMAMSQAGWAGKLGVRVLDANSGLPVANASVCIGTASDRTLYGTGVTSVDGVALYDSIPDKSVLITVSKRNYRGISLQRPPKGDNVVVDITVTEGLSSKKCRALKMVDMKPGITRGFNTVEWPLRITGLSYFPAGRDGLSFLTHTTGKPTHYRVSTRADFSDAKWQPYSDVILYSPLGQDYGKTELFFQLRKVIRADGAEIEALSEVTSHPVAIRRL